MINLKSLIERILKELDNNKPTGITGTTTAQKKEKPMDKKGTDDHWDDNYEPEPYEHDYKHFAPDD